MKRSLAKESENLSYQLYKELAGEICSPINDTEMTLQLRFELYQSKLIYLQNINTQCFRNINRHPTKRDCEYSLEDFKVIQNAIEITMEFLKQTIRESLILSIKIADEKGLYASRIQKNY